MSLIKKKKKDSVEAKPAATPVIAKPVEVPEIKVEKNVSKKKKRGKK